MDIKDILKDLGLDFSNPEVKRGALEAIEAILASRTPISSGSLNNGGGSDNTTELELDPDLLQPSIKQPFSGAEDDIEVEDEENILGQMKHKESEEPIENSNSAGNDSESDIDDSESAEADKSNEASSSNTEDSDTDADTNSDTDSTTDASDDSGSTGDQETNDSISDSDSETPLVDDEADSDLEASDSDENDTNEDTDDAEEPDESTSSSEDDAENDGSEAEAGNALEDEENAENDSEEDDEFEFDEDDLLDDELKNSTEDEEIKSKHNARKIKRERTLAAAKKALADAQTKKVAPALIRELEKAIEALEALTEAVTKNLKDISDEEFNMLVNRVFDAIQACGDSGLTFTSEEEREAQVKEIKNDLSKAETQAELSAEDAAKIRAETQAIKARDKENDKYKIKAAGSFKGFQAFLNSLYRAIALQVQHEETRDDSWSALSRRNSGVGVLQQGKRVQELPNKKIPVIDFYFDCSSSWNANDIKVGKKAVAALADMEEKGQIKINLYYFGDHVSTVYEEVAGEATSGWNEIVKNIIATQATNVIIMTDSDMENWWRGPKALSYTVPGYVWYLWKNGSNAPRLPRDLKGKSGVQQFSFTSNDI
jgi:hypothetical protein